MNALPLAARGSSVALDAASLSVCGVHAPRAQHPDAHTNNSTERGASRRTETAQAANEDFAGVMRPESSLCAARGLLAVVADGVSSSGRGREAAHSAGEMLLEDFPATPVGWDTMVALDRVIASHNDWLWRHNSAAVRGSLETTLTALVVGSRFFTVAHVGDCRCYVLRSSRLTLLTVEHARPVVAGGREMRLTRALGLDERVLVDYRQEPVQLDDTFILVTDGVWSVLPDEDIRSLVQQAASAEQAVAALCHTAVARGSRDDASAVVVRVLDWIAHDLPLTDPSDSHLDLPPQLHSGEQLDCLIVERLVSRGEVNLVYRVRDANTGQALALKTLARGLGRLEDERESLAREHWLCAHAPASVARAMMPREAPSAYYYLFEWIDGRSLAAVAEQPPSVSLGEWLKVARGCLNALSGLHRRGIIHREIKPENLVLQPDGEVRVLDLGVAITRRRDDRACEHRAGTPAYINPEQWDGAAADERSDLFALGVTLFFVLTRKLPYGVVQPYQRAAYQRQPLRCTQLRPDLPVWIDHWLARAYTRRAPERYETAEEMLLTLERAAVRGATIVHEAPTLMQRGSVVLLSIALGLSLLLNVLLVWLHAIVSK